MPNFCEAINSSFHSCWYPLTQNEKIFAHILEALFYYPGCKPLHVYNNLFSSWMNNLAPRRKEQRGFSKFLRPKEVATDFLSSKCPETPRGLDVDFFMTVASNFLVFFVALFVEKADVYVILANISGRTLHQPELKRSLHVSETQQLQFNQLIVVS